MTDILVYAIGTNAQGEYYINLKRKGKKGKVNINIMKGQHDRLVDWFCEEPNKKLRKNKEAK